MGSRDGTQAKPFIFSVKEDAEASKCRQREVCAPALLNHETATPKASTWEKSKSLKHQQLTGIIKLIVTECELEQVTVTNEPVAHHSFRDEHEEAPYRTKWASHNCSLTLF